MAECDETGGVVRPSASDQTFSLKYRLTRGRVRKNRKVVETATPKAVLNISPVAKRASTSPQPSIANNTTANHQAHFLRCNRPVAAAAVPMPSANSSTPEIRPTAWNTAAPGLFSSHNRSKSLLGKIRDVPIARRAHEIAVRIALGAGKFQVLVLIVGQGLKLTLMGIAIGLAGALALTRLIKHLLFGINAIDPTTFLLVALLLAAVSLLASFMPALRATRVDPMVTLRAE
jgi:hypothetical protein